MTPHIRPTRTRRLVAATLGAGALVLGLAASSTATLQPGTPAKDVSVGLDNDNADNPFVQPPGVIAKQHMDNTDILFGRANDDLLIGKLGGDTLLGGSGSDILVGGPDSFTTPDSDVMVGDFGNDINIWAPGDGSDAFSGNQGTDAMIFAPLAKRSDGTLRLSWHAGRRIPHVEIGGQPAVSCTIVKVPAAQKLGFQYLVRFNVDNVPVATVRQKDVEKVYCPSPLPGRARVADLTASHPAFHGVRLRDVKGTTGAILAPAYG